MTSRLMSFVKDRPYHWIPAPTFEQFGRQAWRTRLSEARKKFEAVGDGTIENRQRKVTKHNVACNGPQRCVCRPETFIVSEYRYIPQAERPDQFDANAVQPGRLV